MLISNAAMKDILDANFADIRCTSILLFIRDLLERKNFGGGIEQYRLTNTDTNTKITTLEEFATQINSDKLILDYYRYAEKMGGDRAHPFCVKIGNFKLEFDENAIDDKKYSAIYGGDVKGIMFLINYLSDADPALPLKIYEIKLY